MFEIFTNNDIELLSNGVLNVLERLGMHTPNKDMLQALKKNGAIVDYEAGNARFTKKMVQEFVEEINKENKMHWAEKITGENKRNTFSGWIPYSLAPPEFKAPELPWLFHVGSTFYYDDEKKEKRKAEKKDFINLVKLGDVLHPELGVGHQLVLSDVHPLVEPLEAALVLLEYAHKPRGVFLPDIRQMDYLLEIEEIAGINDPYWHWMGAVSFASPLRLGMDIADRFVYMVKSGYYPAKLYSMATRGVTAPVTVAGSVVLIAAEFIALWISARALNPEIPLTATVLSGVMDMQSGEVDFCGYDNYINKLSVCEFIRKWFGVLVCPGFGEYCQSKVPGFYTALDKAYQAMTYAAFTGFHPNLGFGHIDSGLAFSPVQLFLDRELAKGLRFLESPIVSEETIALDTILDVGFGIKKNYLAAKHTFENFKKSLWEPEFFKRDGMIVENEEKIIKEIIDKIKQMISEYKKPEFDTDRILKIKKVIEKAKERLLQAK